MHYMYHNYKFQQNYEKLLNFFYVLKGRVTRNFT